MKTGEWALATVVKAFLQWMAGFLQRLATAYLKRKEDERENKEIREKMEDAQTDDEIQDALEDAGKHLGGRN